MITVTNKKSRIKINLGRLSRLTAIFVGGSYFLSGLTYGFGNVNKTFKCDFNSYDYDMDYLTLDMDSRDINDLRIEEMIKFDTLKVDMAHSNNLQYLNYYVSLKSIEISNAQLLTDEDIKALNYSNISEIYLFFDRDSTINKLDEGFDLNRFKNKSFIKNIEFQNKKTPDNSIVSYSNELDSIIFFEYLKNYEDCKFKFIKYTKLNDELNHIIDISDENTYDTQIEYLFSIVDYICDHMEYDKEIKESSNKESNSILKKRYINKKLDSYNKYSLSKGIVKNTKKITSAVCTNYADALSALSIKKGFNVHTVTGTCKGYGHAWNIIDLGGYYYLIDLTNYEKINKTCNLIKNYRSNPTQENYEAILSSLLIMINSESLNYFNSSLNILDYVEPKVQENSKDNIYGTNENKYSAAIHNGVLALGAYFLICMGRISAEVIKQKRKYNKNKGPMKKSLDRFSA